MKGLWLKHSAWASESIGPSFIVLVNLCLISSYLQDVQNKVFRLRFKETVLEFETKEKTSVHLKWFLDKPQPRTSLKLARFYSDLKVQNISLKLWITWAPWVRGIFLKCIFNMHILSSSSLLLLVILGLKMYNLNFSYSPIVNTCMYFTRIYAHWIPAVAGSRAFISEVCFIPFFRWSPSEPVWRRWHACV